MVMVQKNARYLAIISKKKASENGWSGFIIYGCIRDSEIISTLDIGIKALDTMPLKSEKKTLVNLAKI